MDTLGFPGSTSKLRLLQDSSFRKHSMQCFVKLYLMLLVCLLVNPIVAKTRHEILLGLLSNDSDYLYDNSVPPNFDEDVPTNVSVQIFVLSFDSVTEASMVNTLAAPSYLKSEEDPNINSLVLSLGKPRHQNKPRVFGSKRQPQDYNQEQHGLEFSVSIFLRQNWTDPRLTWTDEEVKDRLEVDPKMMNHVWVPDLYFVNEKSAIMHDVTVSNKLLHIHRDGTILYSMRLSMTLSCDMHLDRYPHDDQVCSLSLGSYSFSRENVVFKWVEIPVIMRPEMTLPRFQVSFRGAKDCDFLFSQGSMIRGEYSCIQADFHLSREFGYYIAQVYIPSVLIVMLSWVSFWIDIDATPARVSLGLLTVLTMTTQSTGEKAALPRVSYVKAIDVWMSVCLFFVFAALLEFAYVNVQSRVEKRRRESISNNPKLKEVSKADGSEKEIKFPQTIIRSSFFVRDPARVQKARSADKLSRVLFPAAFALFNLIYWIYYR